MSFNDFLEWNLFIIISDSSVRNSVGGGNKVCCYAPGGVELLLLREGALKTDGDDWGQVGDQGAVLKRSPGQ